MKFIKLNNTQAKRISGKEDRFNANGFTFIGENFYIVILEDLLPIAKRYIKKLISGRKVEIIDMSKRTNPDVIKLKAVFKETTEEGEARIATRVSKWDYTKMEIKKEL